MRIIVRLLCEQAKFIDFFGIWLLHEGAVSMDRHSMKIYV